MVCEAAVVPQHTIVIVAGIEENGVRTIEYRFYRMLTGMVGGELKRNGFNVVDREARSANIHDENRILEKSSEDSSLAARQLCHRYDIDVAVILDLHITVEDVLHNKNQSLTKVEKRVFSKMYDQYWNVTATVSGKAYTRKGKLLFDKTGPTFGDDSENKEYLLQQAVKSSTIYFIGKKQRPIINLLAQALTKEPPPGIAVHPSNELTVKLFGFRNYEQLFLFEDALRSPTGVLEVKRKSVRADKTVGSTDLNEAIYKVSFNRQANAMIYQREVYNKVVEFLNENEKNHKYHPNEIIHLRGLDLLTSEDQNLIRFNLSSEKMRNKQWRDNL